MDLTLTLLRTVIVYITVFVMLRLMGKREIGKLSVIDLVISIMIAEISVIIIEDLDKSILQGVLPVVVLVGIQVLLSQLSLKSRKFRLLLEGKPSMIVENGKLNNKEMKNQKYNLDDLMLQLREKGITNISDVEFALLEPTGKLSVVRDNSKASGHSAPKMKSNNKYFNTTQLKNIHFTELPIPLIMDGKVQDHHLEDIHKTRFWLKNVIQQHGIQHFKDVLLCTVNHNGEIYVDKKDT
ncbi:DUF421 domain-containing protein [Longirhabdus pacifica]|uniref:DUF421 domain-containing protein n=1 Tax=Longirhabdus pacifica TaxID=2305227 RepID=UPI001F0C14C6|nr:DUF421 domain-containing protein [Longirhabdus pacifica]